MTIFTETEDVLFIKALEKWLSLNNEHDSQAMEVQGSLGESSEVFITSRGKMVFHSNFG